jgi:hypothetical protein
MKKVIQQGSVDEKASIVGCFFRQKFPLTALTISMDYVTSLVIQNSQGQYYFAVTRVLLLVREHNHALFSFTVMK